MTHDEKTADELEPQEPARDDGDGDGDDEVEAHIRFDQAQFD